VHGSPSGFDDFNTGARLAHFSNGRVTSASYVYGDLNIVRQTLLPKGFSLINQFSDQYAGRPVPDSQQIELGGPSAVRGYSLDDGAWDDGGYLRNELHAPLLSLFRRGPLPASLDVMVFGDLGYGHDDVVRNEVRMASVGVGATIQLGALVTASLDYAHPMTNAKVTGVGDDHLDARLTIAY
jgi:hemolysin activation/secretion protein